MRPDLLAVLGLGATGGSVAWQARQAGVPRVIGWSPSRADGVAALRAGALDDLTDRADRAVAGAGFVVIALPFQQTLDLLARIARRLTPPAVVAVMSGVQVPLLARAVELGLGDVVAGVHFFGEDAGAGFDAARPDRLRRSLAYVCATGSEAGHGAAANVIGFLTEALDADPVLIAAGRHDAQVAWTSHLPRAAAAVLARTLDGQKLGGVSWDAAAREAVRAVPRDAEEWSDLLIANHEEV
ncbi:MAG: prephenate dehydrogenase/arogenate dehydrogenase family protein, partial [Gemmatimonadales bacterium]